MISPKSIVQYDAVQEKATWSLQKDIAEVLIKSQAIPADIKEPAQAMAIIQMGRELGYPPMIAMQNIKLIKGTPALSSNLIGARLKDYGYDFDVLELNESKCTIEFIKPNKKTFKYSYTIEDAKRANLTYKDNWQKMPKDMLYARALSKGGRIVAPEVLTGIYEQGEIQDFKIETKTPEVGEVVTPSDIGKNENLAGVDEEKVQILSQHITKEIEGLKTDYSLTKVKLLRKTIAKALVTKLITPILANDIYKQLDELDEINDNK